MKRVILTVALGTALSSAAFAQSVGEKTGVNSVLGVAPKTEDFIKEAAMSDMLEIEAAKIAQQKGSADDKKFAERMITDHTKTSSELKSMVPSDMQGAVPASLDDSSQKKLNKFVTRSLKTLRRSMTRCRSAPTRTLSRYSSATPKAARIQS